MDLYGQERDVQLLAQLLARLEDRSVIDVGAERGAFVEALLEAGSTRIDAIEPEPDNAQFLRTRYGGEGRVVVHECAVAEVDGAVDLHTSTLTYGHTLIERADTDEIAWPNTISVPGRSLASLLQAGDIPRRVGILKIDTEGSDFAVLAGMGELECDVIMFEHWTDLPDLLGPCPWSIDEVRELVRPRGFSQFVCLEHRGEFAILRWNDGDVPAGSSANVVFVHDSVLDSLMPVLLESGARIADDVLSLAESYAAEAHARLGVIEELVQDREPHLVPPTGAVRSRIHFWTRPRIGTLHHYDPKPLTVPAKYLETSPPDPAPTISIVTPSLGQGRYIAKAIHSVVQQDYPALEYVVQDGGSVDETTDVLRRFESSLTGWRSEPDRGQADAINRGFRDTTGDIMAWLNADDLLLPGSLAYVARFFAAHPEVDVVYGNRVMIDEHDGQIGTWVLPAHDDDALALADYVPQETLFWRRRIWEAAGGQVDPSFSYALDWDLLVRFREAGANMVRLPRFLAAFRVHEAQKTTALLATGAAECDAIRERLHGRPLPPHEIFKRLKPYLVKSMLADMRQRTAERFAGRRVEVRTVAPNGFTVHPRRSDVGAEVAGPAG